MQGSFEMDSSSKTSSVGLAKESVKRDKYLIIAKIYKPLHAATTEVMHGVYRPQTQRFLK